MTINNVLDFTENLDFEDFELVYNNLTEQRKSRLHSKELNDWRDLVGRITEYCKKHGGIIFESFDSKIYFTADDFDSGVIGLFKRKNDNQTGRIEVPFDDNITNKLFI